MSREKFEQDIKARFGDSIDYRVCKNSDGEYMAWDMQVAWWAWQAASKASEQQLAALAVENAGLEKRMQQLIDIISNAGNDYCMCGDAMKNHTHGGCGHPTGMFDYHYNKWLESGDETPATDAAIANIQAQGVDAAIERLIQKFEGTGHIGVPVMVLESFAAQLRQGAAL